MRAIDNNGREYAVTEKNGTYTVKKEDVSENVEYIDIINEDFFANEGEKGYYVIADSDNKGSRLCLFNQKENGERVYKQNLMPIFGVKKENGCTLVIVEGMKYEFYLVFGVKDKRYYIYPRFMLSLKVPYEDIVLKTVELGKDAEYSEIAVEYRKYQLDTGNCIPISKKAAERPELDYAVSAPEIRIRMGWKPAPCTILHQTPENEPEMKVTCTFARVREIIDELKKQGVDKAQICLVGWNKSGHDGRYPQIFPVEERLGGEKALRDLLAYAKENGYSIVCHTNSTDCYSIAEEFSYDMVIKNPDKSLSINSDRWSGGRMYNLCPKFAWEFAKRDLPKVADMGFRGLHYIDVMSVVPLRACFDKNHPSDKKQTLEYYNKIMELSTKLFGGFASEGTYDFTAKYLDYGLYVAWPDEENPMVDKEIPLWETVYHGCILYNITTDTVNYTIKDVKNRLKLAEYGGRPSFYFYSKHLVGTEQDDWLGREDMLCDTDEQLEYSVSKIKEAYDEYKKIAHLQREFIEKHEEVAENVYQTAFSNGEIIETDYNSGTYCVKCAK